MTVVQLVNPQLSEPLWSQSITQVFKNQNCLDNRNCLDNKMAIENFPAYSFNNSSWVT